MTTETKTHPLAGQTVVLRCKDDPDHLNGRRFRVEDYWITVTGKSWMWAQGNPAALKYAIRSAVAGLPTDDDVLYGHTEDGYGHLVHVSEIGEPEGHP